MPFKPNHREIVLTDSQETLTVRNVSEADYMYVGRMPDTAEATFIAMAGKPNVNVQDIDPATANFLTEVLIERGVVKQSGELTLVPKQPRDCIEGEISFYDLSERDQAELSEAVFSGGAGLPARFLEKVGEGIRKKQEREASEQAGQAKS